MNRNALNLIAINLVSLSTVGLLGSVILAESFGPAIGWAAGLAMSVGFACAAYEGKKAGKGGWALAAGLSFLTLGLAFGRIIHGAHDVQESRDAVAKVANDLRAECIEGAKASRAAKAEAYKGSYITKMSRAWDTAEAAEIAECKENFPAAKATEVTLQGLTGVEWFRILGPIWIELFASICVKLLAGAMVTNLRKHSEAQADAEAMAKLEAELELAQAKANGAEAKLAALKAERTGNEWIVGPQGGQYKVVNGRKVYRKKAKAKAKKVKPNLQLVANND